FARRGRHQLGTWLSPRDERGRAGPRSNTRRLSTTAARYRLAMDCRGCCCPRFHHKGARWLIVGAAIARSRQRFTGTVADLSLNRGNETDLMLRSAQMVSGDLLREARLRAGLTQAELAERAATARSQVSRWERGEVLPSLETLRRLIRECGLELSFRLFNADLDEHDA